MANAMANSPGVFWGLMTFSLMLGALFLGAYAGSVAWGSATVLGYGVLGRWPAGGRHAGRPRAAPAFAPAHDAFDDIR